MHFQEAVIGWKNKFLWEYTSMKQPLLFLLLCLIVTSQTWAKDVATEQYKVTYAQKEYDAAKSEYSAATKQVKEQGKLLAQEQALLKEQRRKHLAAKKRMNETRAHL